MHRPELVCPAQELGSYLQGQGHNKGLYDHNVTVSTISVLLYFLPPTPFFSLFFLFLFFFSFCKRTLLVDQQSLNVLSKCAVVVWSVSGLSRKALLIIPEGY